MTDETDDYDEVMMITEMAAAGGLLPTTGTSPPSITTNPRALLVRNIPLTSTGHGLCALLRSAFEKVKTGKATTVSKIILNKTVHRRVRNGTCVVIFKSSEDAAAALSAVEQTIYEGNVLDFTFAAGQLRDHFFPSLPYERRREVHLDPTATFSVTDEITARRMSSVLRVFSTSLNGGGGNGIIVDCMSCVGGNAFAFVHDFHSVTAIEMDPVRHALLQKNAEIVFRGEKEEHSRRLHIVDNPMDCWSWLRGQSIGDSCGDVWFFDPPWGGTDYKTIITEKTEEEFSLEAFSRRIVQLARSGVIDGDVTAPPPPPVIAMKLPTSGFDFTAFARLITSRTTSSDDLERPFPFTLQFGASTTLLVIMPNAAELMVASQSSAPLRRYMRTCDLDSVVHSVHDWHVADGIHEHRPKFFDFEKDRWIELKKWKGTKIPHLLKDE
eukprot:PhM_4_TR1694/c0_g1_i1/m.19038